MNTLAVLFCFALVGISLGMARPQFYKNDYATYQRQNYGEADPREIDTEERFGYGGGAAAAAAAAAAAGGYVGGHLGGHLGGHVGGQFGGQIGMGAGAAAAAAAAAGAGGYGGYRHGLGYGR